MLKKTLRPLLGGIVLALFCASAVAPARAQGVGTRYVHDERGRLRAVITPAGEAAVYEYDPAGNVTRIRRLRADQLELLAFSPRVGLPGTLVTFVGVGFGAGVNSVSFNGAAARVVEFNASAVVAEVPEGATTGPVTLNTARGTVMTTTPFTVQGVRLSPATSTLLAGESVQLSADVSLPGAAEGAGLLWSVDGAVGGNAGVGMITPEGLYTAPDNPPSTLTHTVRATSVALPLVFGEARVTVRSLETFRLGLSPGLTVRRGFTDGTVEAKLALSPGLAVRRGFTDGTTASKLGLSPGVAVRRGFTDGTVEAKLGLSPGVAVRRGFTDGTTESKLALSPGVTVGRGVDASQLALSDGMAVAKGPVISVVSPAGVARGATVTLTLAGANLTGASSITFLNPDGSVETGLVASGLSVNAAGTSLTATLSVQASIILGRRIIVVTTPAGRSPTDNNGANTVEVVNH